MSHNFGLTFKAHPLHTQHSGFRKRSLCIKIVVKGTQNLLLPPPRRLYFRLGLFVLSLFVRLFVNKITQKLMDGF